MSETVLVDQESPKPTRKVTAATGLSGLIGGVVAAIIGVFPSGVEQEVRDALTIVIDALIGFFLSGGAAFIGGYFVRDKKPKPAEPTASPPPKKIV